MPAESPNVVFVCLGNICRSPLALALYARQGGGNAISRALQDWNVGVGADSIVAAVAAAKGVQLTDHRAAQLSDADEQWADVLVVMEQEHRVRLIERFGERVVDKIMLLDADDRDIADPWSLGTSAAEMSFSEIERGVASLPERLLSRFES